MPSVGAVTSNLTVVGTTGNYTAKPNEFVNASALSGALTVTLPAAPPRNTLVAVKKFDASTNMVTVVPAGAATLNGDTAMGLPVQGAAATLQFDGTDWQLLSTAAVNSTTPAGLPTGGTSGQVLTKNSSANYAATWSTPTGVVPTGGTTGQVLTKSSATNYDAAWSTPTATITGALPPWAAGRMVTPPLGIQHRRAPLNAHYWVPVWVPNACTIASIGIFITSYTAAGTFWAQVYADSPTAASKGPTTRIGVQGSVAVNGAYMWSATVNAVIASPRLVWLCYGLSSSGNTMICTYGQPQNTLIGGVGNDMYTTQGLNGTVYHGSYANPGSGLADMSAVVMTAGILGFDVNSSFPVPFLTIA